MAEVSDEYTETTYDYINIATFRVILGKYAEMRARTMGDAIEKARAQLTNARWEYVQIERMTDAGRQILSVEQAEEYVKNNFAIITLETIDSYAETEEAADERLEEVMAQYPQFAPVIRVEAI